MGLLLAVAATVAGSAEPIRVAVSHPLPPALAVGARVMLAVTSGRGPTRATERLAECFEVLGVTTGEGDAQLALAPGRSEGPAIPIGAVARAALCQPDGSYVVALPPSVPRDWGERLRAGDRVDALASFAVDRPDEDFTVTFLSDAPLVSSGNPSSPVALSLLASQVEPWFHAVDAGRIAVSLRTAPGEPDVRHMATTVPLGMRFLAVPLPEGAGPEWFAQPAGYVDAVAVIPSSGPRILLHAVFVVPVGPSGRTTVAMVTADQAELWAHAAMFGSLALVLRNDLDVEMVQRPETMRTTRPPPDPAACREAPCALVARQMRGLVAFTSADVAPGTTVDLVVRPGSAGDPVPVSTHRSVLAVGTTASGAPIALLHVTPAEALAAANARAGGVLVTQPPPPR